MGSKVEMEYQKEERDNQSHRERDNSLFTNAMLLSVAEQWVWMQPDTMTFIL